MKSRYSLLFTCALIIGDVLAVLGAYSIAYILRVKISDIPIVNFVPARTYFDSLLLLLPFVIILFSLIGLYRPQRKPSALIGKLLMGSFSAMIFMIFIDYFHYAHIFPAKRVPLYGMALSMVFVLIERGFLHLIRYYRHRHNIGTPSVIVIGDNDIARVIVDNIKQPSSGYRLQAVVGDRRLKWTTHKTFAQAVENFYPNIIIQVTTTKEPTVNQDILQFAQKNYIDFKFVPCDVNDLSERLELELFMDEIPMMSVQPTRLVGWGRVAKRAFDLLVSLALLILLSPVLLVIWVAEKCSDQGASAIFHQTRLTRGDHEFQLYKFRSQYAKYDGTTPEEAFRMMGKPGLAKKYRSGGDYLENDPRVTKIGRFLRKTSLDELPQLFNVLTGDISLVGPRALIPEELNCYEQKHKILNVKSGITGLAQISGRRDLPWDQRRKLDVYYVQNWSFSLDIQILFQTAWQVITGRGAQ